MIFKVKLRQKNTDTNRKEDTSMDMDIAKYARGTVWFYKPLHNDKIKGVQSKSRPALIISNNKLPGTVKIGNIKSILSLL